jgi:putative flavoprotein involved in K+ transport
VTREPGLYFLGLPWQHTRGSALLGWIKADARYIADEISAFATDRSTLRSSPAAALPESAPR